MSLQYVTKDSDCWLLKDSLFRELLEAGNTREQSVTTILRIRNYEPTFHFAALPPASPYPWDCPPWMTARCDVYFASDRSLQQAVRPIAPS